MNRFKSMEAHLCSRARHSPDGLRRVTLPSPSAIRNFVLAMVLLNAAALAQAAPPKDAKPGASRSASAPPSGEIEIPQSVFLIPATPKEGRNPFFPRSTATLPPPIKKESLVDSSSLHLTGITSPPRATAMINNKTFEKGEEGEVKLASGNKLLIRCEQIKEDSVVILINGSQRRELRLRSGV